MSGTAKLIEEQLKLEQDKVKKRLSAECEKLTATLKNIQTSTDLNKIQNTTSELKELNDRLEQNKQSQGNTPLIFQPDQYKLNEPRPWPFLQEEDPDYISPYYTPSSERDPFLG